MGLFFFCIFPFLVRLGDPLGTPARIAQYLTRFGEGVYKSKQTGYLGYWCGHPGPEPPDQGPPPLAERAFSFGGGSRVWLQSKGSNSGR